ncbi:MULTISPECIES: BMP family lipoprotein [Kocuria]|uniref:BMP family lipoprotein n=1 Tax=Kocuria TaxID=57493 RepID=UPI0006D7E3F2|nr:MULTISPECIES: BMP family ABC transporter substrate-binding protein [Kocuria]MDN5630288.1 BMP family ABC transporter substrate-binding protein [Kocuria sp.]
MTTRRFRALGALGLAGVTGLVLAGCGSAPDSSGGSSQQASDFKGCIVSDDGGFQDRSFNQSSYEGLKAAEEHKGIQVSQAESQSETEFEPNLTSMTQQGCNLTVSVGFLLADTTKKVAAANPDKHFAIVDDNSITADNVKPIVYNTAEAAFLAGYLAAGTTQTGKVATYGGMDIPTVTVFMDGFADGVKYYNEKNKKDVKVLGWNKDSQNGTFLSSFQDSSKAKTVTQNLIGDGVDVVLPVAGQAAQGTVDAVSEANKGGDEVRLIWPDTDGYESLDSGKEYVLTSVLKEMSKSVEEVVTQAADGTFDHTQYVGTLENGGVGLAPYHDQEDAVGEDLDKQVQQLNQDVIDGKVTVESKSAPKS